MDYELIDSGDGYKLEKWGQFVLKRPDPQVIWKPRMEKWGFDAEFKNGKWNKRLPDWEVKINELVFKISLTSFKHTGVFPEHVDNWNWIQKLKIKNSKILNLFGYTGGATLAAAKTGAEVTHVDASKPAITRARENILLSGLEKAPIRWIVDDALDFVKREVKRGNVYDGIIMDPPSFGRGAKGQVWKIEESLLPLLEACKEICPPAGGWKFILLNGYASGYSASAYAQILSSVFELPLEKIEKGELSIKENSERGFVLPAGIFARYKNG